jgi:Diadenosine tetraphosphate (Ap4A) hydrolase and other HIT family hydrolases
VDRIFAPWRIDWIRDEEKNPAVEECVFCELPELGADRDHRIVARGDHSFVVMNVSPYSPGHALVVPYRHTGRFTAFSDRETVAHARLKQETVSVLEAVLDADGINAGTNVGSDAAGGSIGDHVHTHVVPRWTGDTERVPRLSDADDVDGVTDAIYDELRETFAARADASPGPDTAPTVNF